MLPLLAALAGTGLSFAGKEKGASAYRHEVARNAAHEADVAKERRGSIRQALEQLAPEHQLAQALQESKVYHGQQDEAQALARAYGIDNAAVGDRIAELGPSINDAAWGRAFGLVGDANQRALAEERGREGDIDAREWWWQRFLPNRLERAGQSGQDMREIGQILQAYGLGGMKQEMAAPARLPSTTAVQAGSDATNAATGAAMTDDLQDRSWLGLGGSRPAYQGPIGGGGGGGSVVRTGGGMGSRWRTPIGAGY